jgi:hypothetical protein
MRKQNVKETLQMLTVAAITFACIGFYICTSDAVTERYAVASDNYANEGRHYEYYTDANVKVTNVSGTEVTIEYDGNLYTFYAESESDYKTGQKCKVTFNEAMEIVDAE